MDSPEFQLRITSEIKSLEARDTELATTEETVRRERTELRARISDLTRVVNVYREFMGLSTNVGIASLPLFPTPETAGSGTNGSKPTRTIAAIAEEYIAGHGGRARVSDVLAELVRLGRLKGKHGDYGTVFGTLRRNPKRFMKVGTGEFAVLSPSAPDKA